MRWLSLGLLVVTLGKVFLHDLGELEDLYRVASLVGLAVSLIIVSLVYQRFVFRGGAQRVTRPPPPCLVARRAVLPHAPRHRRVVEVTLTRGLIGAVGPLEGDAGHSRARNPTRIRLYAAGAPPRPPSTLGTSVKSGGPITSGAGLSSRYAWAIELNFSLICVGARPVACCKPTPYVRGRSISLD